MLHPLITVRHDQDWAGASVILVVLAFVVLVSLIDWWAHRAHPGPLTADYDDRITAPWPPRPAGGDSR